MTFFSLMKIVGHGFEQIGRSDKPGWVAMSLCLGFSLLVCMAVHPYCVLFCMACCVPMIIFFHHADIIVRPSRKQE
jgi:hypothetical protein